MLLDRLGRQSARHHRLVIALWILAVVLVSVGKGVVGGSFVDNFTVPGTESQTAVDLLTERFSAQSGIGASVVIVSPTGSVSDPAAATAIAQTQAKIESLALVSGVEVLPSPTTPSIELLNVQYSGTFDQIGKAGYADLVAATAPATAAGLDVNFGGQLTDYAVAPPNSPADFIGLLLSVVILIFAFGAIVAAGLPLITALFGLAVGVTSISIIAAFTNVGTVAPLLAIMIGLGVGIDYSLFIVTRHRENRAAGMEIEDSIARATGTAGQAVLFAGITVVIAITGLVIAGIPYVSNLGFMTALVVFVMMIAALTLIPALLGAFGDRINNGSVARIFHRKEKVATNDGKPNFWERWATHVARHPWFYAVATLIILITLAVPFTSIRYGQPDDGSQPSGTTERIAYDTIAKGFGAGVNGPLVIAVTYPAGGSIPPNLVSSIQNTPGVVTVVPPSSPTTINAADNTAVITVIPSTSPDAAATTALINKLRSSVIPEAIKGTQAQAYVGGETATFIDLGDRVKDRLPFFILAVVLLSFILLMMVFHSVVIPATAAAMNLLSVGAAYGVTVAVFQWGWGIELIGLDATIPIVSFIPMMMFAVLFGLSMDYQVFLLTRIREEYDEKKDTRAAVVAGVSKTARVITSAALIMITVFGAFVFNPTPLIKMFGLGLAVAVAVDATLVRMILVPSLMEIFGKANWWFPKWLNRMLPKINIE